LVHGACTCSKSGIWSETVETGNGDGEEGEVEDGGGGAAFANMLQAASFNGFVKRSFAWTSVFMYAWTSGDITAAAAAPLVKIRAAFVLMSIEVAF
jgi:hypothetical protein